MEEEENVEQRSEKKISNERIKKHLLSLLLASFTASYNKNANTTI